MYLIYTPEGSEPTLYKFEPNKMMSPEQELIERKTDRNFGDFTEDVVKGSSVCRRALLYVMRKREHPTTRWEDCTFAWGELRLDFSRQEYQAMIDEAPELRSGQELEDMLSALREAMKDAPDDEDYAGKAGPPSAD